MSKLLRYTQKIFGSTCPPDQLVEIGSLAAGAGAFAITPADVQTLSNYLSGWSAIVLGGNSPAIEDMNSLCYLFAYQLAYIFQSGIPEYDSGTIYFKGSLCTFGGLVYQSVVDTNSGHALSDAAFWKVQNRGARIVTATDTATVDDDFLRLDPTSAAFVETLPPVATCVGKTIIVKNISQSGNAVTIKGDGTELIDFANSFDLTNPGDSANLFNNGTTWDVL